MSACVKCSVVCVFKDVTRSKDIKDLFGAPCDFCKQVFCSKCSEISSCEIRALVSQSKVINFYCFHCRSSIRDALVALPVLQSGNLALGEKVEKLNQDLSNLISAKADHTKSYCDALKADLESRSAELSSEIDILNGKITAQGVSTQTVVADPPSMDNGGLMQEIFERQKRMNNVMLYNMELLPDIPEATQVSNILQTVTGKQVQVNDVVKLGRPNRNGRKSIKLVLSNHTDVANILKLRSKFISSKRIYVEADLSPGQREDLQRVKDDLERRRSNGEANLVIKFERGKPFIASKN